MPTGLFFFFLAQRDQKSQRACLSFLPGPGGEPTVQVLRDPRRQNQASGWHLPRVTLAQSNRDMSRPKPIPALELGQGGCRVHWGQGEDSSLFKGEACPWRQRQEAELTLAPGSLGNEGASGEAPRSWQEGTGRSHTALLNPTPCKVRFSHQVKSFSIW